MFKSKRINKLEKRIEALENKEVTVRLDGKEVGKVLIGQIDKEKALEGRFK